jgi:hypothetical protein
MHIEIEYENSKRDIVSLALGAAVGPFSCNIVYLVFICVFISLSSNLKRRRRHFLILILYELV